MEEREILEEWNLQDEDEQEKESVMTELEYESLWEESHVCNMDYVSKIDDLQKLQNECPDLSRIIKYLRTGELPTEEKIARQTVFESEDYFFQDEILKHKYTPK